MTSEKKESVLSFETDNDRRLTLAISLGVPPDYVSISEQGEETFPDLLAEQEIFNPEYTGDEFFQFLKSRGLTSESLARAINLSKDQGEEKEEKEEEEEVKKADLESLASILEPLFTRDLESFYSLFLELFPKLSRYGFAMELFKRFQEGGLSKAQDPFFLSLLFFLKDSSEEKGITYAAFEHLLEKYIRLQKAIVSSISAKAEEIKPAKALVQGFYGSRKHSWESSIESSYRIYKVEPLDKEASVHRIFNAAAVSYEVPYMVMNLGSIQNHKVLKGAGVNYDTVTKLGRTAERFFKVGPNNITFNVYTGPLNKNYFLIPSKSLVKCLWDLDEQKLLLKIPTFKDYQPNLLELVSKAFNVKVSKEFKYANLKVRYQTSLSKPLDVSLLYPFLSNHEVYKRYFYIDESRRPYSESTKTNIYFNYNEEAEEVKKPRATFLIHEKEISISIIASDDKIAERCHLFFTSLLNAFIYYYPTLDSFYSRFVDKSGMLEEAKSASSVKMSTFFGKNYSRTLCPSQGAPTLILDKAKLEQYQNSEVKKDIQPIQDWVDTSIEAHLVCANPKYPYMVKKLIEETGVTIPCCGATSKDRVLKAGKQAQNMVKTFKIVGKEVEGVNFSVPSIKGFSGITRLGVVGILKDSFLHCVARALFTSEYKADPVKTVSGMREALSKKTYPPVYQQSLYQYSEAKVTEMLKDRNLFFDPLLFYRGVEELYGYNIYVFENLNETGEVSPVLPSFPSIYAKPYTDRPCLCILRNSGTEESTRAFPQSELLVGPEKKVLHSSEVSRGIWEFLHKKYVQIYQPPALREERPLVFRSLFSHTSLDKFMRSHCKGTLELTGQTLDAYGHSRIFNYLFTGKGKKESLPLSVFVPPSQPGNFPSSSTFYSLSLDRATSIFGTPTATSRREGLCNGVWFPALGIEALVFIPLLEEKTPKSLEPLPVLSSDFHFLGEKNHTSVYESLKKNASVYTSLLNTALNLFLSEGGDKEEFISLLKVGKTVYNFEVFKGKRYPSASSFKEFLSVLKDMVPSFCDGKNLLVESQKFLERLVFHVNSYNPVPVEREPFALFSRSSDFSSKGALVFTHKDFEFWQSNRRQLGYHASDGQEWLSTSLYPYLISVQGNKMFIVQNVESHNFYRALDAGLHFLSSGIVERAAPPLSSRAKVCPYKVYSYDGAKLILLQDEAQEEEVYVSILSHTNLLRDQEEDGRFALLIPIT